MFCGWTPEKFPGGFNEIETHDLSDAGKMLYQFQIYTFKGKDLMDIHTNHNSKKMTILNQLLELNIPIAIR